MAEDGLTVKVDTSGLSRAIGSWSAAMGVSLPDAIRNQAARLVSDITRHVTPPKTKSQGMSRVRTDVRKAIDLVRPKHIKSDKLRKLRRTHPEIAAKVLSGGKKRLVEPGHYYKTHENARDRRGRVRRRKTLTMTFDVTAWQAYVKSRQAYVGMAKGAWSKSYEYLRSRVRYRKPRPLPKWMRQSKFQTRGAVKDTLKNFGKNASVIASNMSPWANYRNSITRAMDWVIKKRIRNMENATAAVIRKDAKKSGFSVPF